MKKALFLITTLLLTGCMSTKTSQNKDQLVCLQIIDRNGLNETISTKERLSKYKHVDFVKDPQPYKQITEIYQTKNNQKKSQVITYHPNGNIFQYLEIKEGRANGSYKQWHENGKIAIEAFLIGGPGGFSDIEQSQWIFDKENKVWDEKGNIVSVFNYLKGDLEGNSYYYHTNGKTQKIEPYTKNQLNGTVTEYNDKGDIIVQITYKTGLKEGEAISYWQNDIEAKIIRFKEEYKNDTLLQGNYFDASQNILSKIENGNGTKTIIDKTSSDKILVEYNKGKPEGKIQFLKKDILQNIYHIKNNQKHGEEIKYYPQKDKLIPKLSLWWNEDIISGTVKTWYENENMQSQKEMLNNKKHGTSAAWYKDGSVMFIEEYENDILQKGLYYKKNESIPISTVLSGNGTATLFDESGNFLKTIKYEKGTPETD